MFLALCAGLCTSPGFKCTSAPVLDCPWLHCSSAGSHSNAYHSNLMSISSLCAHATSTVGGIFCSKNEFKFAISVLCPTSLFRILSHAVLIMCDVHCTSGHFNWRVLLSCWCTVAVQEGSVGVIAGIVVGCILAVGLLFLVGVFVYYR